MKVSLACFRPLSHEKGHPCFAAPPQSRLFPTGHGHGGIDVLGGQRRRPPTTSVAEVPPYPSPRRPSPLLPAAPGRHRPASSAGQAPPRPQAVAPARPSSPLSSMSITRDLLRTRTASSSPPATFAASPCAAPATSTSARTAPWRFCLVSRTAPRQVHLAQAQGRNQSGSPPVHGEENEDVNADDVSDYNYQAYGNQD